MSESGQIKNWREGLHDEKASCLKLIEEAKKVTESQSYHSLMYQNNPCYFYKSILSPHFSNVSLFGFTPRNITCLCHFHRIHFPIRFMMSSACSSTVRTAYYLMKILSNNLIIDKTTKENTKPLTDALVAYSLDSNQGVIAHKSKFAMHIMAGKYPAQNFYDAYITNTNYNNISCVSGTSDTRILAEFPTLSEFFRYFNKDIHNVQANVDNVIVSMNTYPGQKQTNPDWTVAIKKVCNSLTFANYNKTNYYDQKSGKDMLSHSTSGSVGIIPEIALQRLQNVPEIREFMVERLIHDDLPKISMIMPTTHEEYRNLDHPFHLFVQEIFMQAQQENKAFKRLLEDYATLIYSYGTFEFGNDLPPEDLITEEFLFEDAKNHLLDIYNI